MKWQVIKIRVLQWLKRIVFYSLYTILVFFIVAYALLQIPAVQKGLAIRLTRGFSELSGFDIQFSRFYFLWYDRLEIKDLKITDPQHNTMIAAEQLYINFRLSILKEKNNINIDAVSLTKANVNLITIPASDSTRDLNINIFIAAINKQFASSGGGKGPRINIGEVQLEESRFGYNMTEKDSIRNGFDYNHFTLDLAEGDVDDFLISGDTIEFQVVSLQIKDQKTKLQVKDLSTFFRISQHSMEFLGLNLNCNQSHVSDTIIFKFQRQSDMGDFNTKVTINASFKETKLYSEDVRLFTGGLEQFNTPVTLNGKFKGKVSHFTFRPMSIVMGSTAINGSLEMDGLPVINETFINAKLDPSTVAASDIAPFLPESIRSNVGPFNVIKLKGNFLGFVNDFVANGDLVTRFGKIKSDINYKIAENNVGLSSYDGKLKLTDFDLGTFFKDTVSFQKVNLNGQISGKGFSKETADFALLGEISSIGVRGYNYVNIRTNARFAKQFFKGELTIDDPNLQFTASGSIDLRKGKDLINIQAKLDTALLHELKLSKEEIFLQSYVDIDSKGLELDSLVGSALFKKTLVQFRDESIRFDSIHLISANEFGQRKLTLRSSMVDLSLAGDFYYSSLFYDIEKLVREFMLNLKNDPFAIRNYYQSKRKSDQAYRATIAADIHDVNKVFQVLDIDLYTSKEIIVQGEFSNNITSSMHFYTTIDTLVTNGQVYTGNEIEFDGSKVRDSTQVLAQLTINSMRQQLSKNLTTKNLFAEAIWNKDHIDFDFDFDQEGYDNTVRLRAEIDFLKDSTKIHIRPSIIRIMGEPWTVNRDNYTLVSGPEWYFHSLGLIHGDQSIKVEGAVSRDPLKAFRADIQNFDIAFLNSFSQEKFKGMLNAEIIGRDIYADAFIENKLTIDSLTINKFMVGKLTGNNTRDPLSDHFNIDLTIDRMETRIVDIKGFYDPSDKTSPLHTKAILANANLKLIEPIVRDLFSQLDGTLTGEYDIQGTFSEPRINGQAVIHDGQLMVNYLKTLYKVKGTLGMTTGQVQFLDFELTDAFKNKGTLQGYLAHRHFSNIHINLDATFSNLQVLNTTAKDNDLFYGQAFGTGRLNIIGPASNLKISATARTNKNTRLSIPVQGVASEEKKEFIQFINFTDSLKKKIARAKARKKELSGLTLDLQIDVTPDAYAEIIFDIKSGDIIRGRGRGDIKLQIDTKGDFNMFGLMEFTEGAYNFTLYDVINKEFTIKPGSQITWYGNPYEGNLHITASYRQLTSLAPIIADQTLINDPNIRRKYPVEVLLKLDGPMLSPDISFDITAPELPDNVQITLEGKNSPSVRLKFEFNVFKAKLDEQEMRRQAFSLIILRKFSPPDAFTTSASGSLYNSVSELLSNQLSYWLSQVDQNLEIDLDLGTLDQEAFNTFQLRMSYSFLSGRLRVTKDGSFGNQTNRSELSTIAGDWTVDYLLTPDGKFKVKMYSRSTVNQLQSSLNTQTAGISTGVSLLYTENFNEFRDLLRSARERRRRELERNKDPEKFQ
jgi:hypothetical protein